MLNTRGLTRSGKQPATWRRDLPAMNEADAHWHDGHEIAYASKGVLVMHTGTSRWIAPPHRAMWIPAGVVHAHRKCGATRLHSITVPADVDSPDLQQPAMFGVAPLLRELIITCADMDDRSGSPHGQNLLEFLVDELQPVLEPSARLPVADDRPLGEHSAMLEADPFSPSAPSA